MPNDFDPKKIKVPFGTFNEKGILDLPKGFKVSSDILQYIPDESARLYNMIPLFLQNEKLYVGSTDAGSLDARDALNFIASREGKEYVLLPISKDTFEELLEQYNQVETALTEALEDFEEQENVVLGIGEDEEGATISGDLIKEEAPVIKLVSRVLAEAVEKKASDIHIEPHPTYSIVRFRVDGILYQALKFPRKVHAPLVARIKILTNLRLDERRRPQDGRFSSSIRKVRIDFRVSTFPTSEGEKTILRVLDRTQGLRSLSDLGLSEFAYERLLEAVNRPYGLILASGPTGAGKTTTLYALLNILDKTSKNIVSLEDPVEYSLDGINQSQIRPEIGYTFATGLRSVLRGDPDQILVGEIRDKETAQLAVQAALTGHIVFSTIHTNTAIGAINRLENFGIEPFLLAPTLSLVIGQRMTRRIEGDGKDVPLSKGMRGYLEKQFADLPQKYRSQIPVFDSFKEAVPTEGNPSGMKGRVGVFEVLNIDEDIRSHILERNGEGAIYKTARQKGMVTLAEDAITKGLEGTIPISEVVKVSSEKDIGDLESVGLESLVEQEQGLEEEGKSKETNNTQK